MRKYPVANRPRMYQRSWIFFVIATQAQLYIALYCQFK